MASFPLARATTVVPAFRAAIEACPTGFMGRGVFEDVPYLAERRRPARAQSWIVTPADLPIVGVCRPVRVLQAGGPYIAFLRFFIAHGSEQAVTPIVAAAAALLPHS